MSKRKKRRKIILWVAGATAVLVVVGLFAVNYGINYFLNMMADDALEELAHQAGLEGAGAGGWTGAEVDGSTAPVVEGSAANSASSTSVSVGRSTAQQVPASHEGGNGSSTGRGTGAQAVDGASGSVPGSPPAGSTSVDVVEPTPPVSSPPQDERDVPVSDADNKLSYSAEISTEKAEKVQESITLSEKAKLTRVILANFGAEELNLFMQLAQGGLTVEEKREAKKLFLEKLTPEEYDELISIAAKYGLSRGKTYEESVRTERYD
jgi:hypothetical protein